ncbi:hypothetical protein FQN51_004927 [Onygenales sp. PD_10]|nr:hypothetical protein FQN51_004927 [Onygenales sp. PD_10]
MEVKGVNMMAAKVSHVNLMTDTVIANLSPEALRVILRSMAAADDNGQFTHKLQHHVQKYLRHELERCSIAPLFSSHNGVDFPTPALAQLRGRISSLFGSGLAFESLQLLRQIVCQSSELSPNENTPEGARLVAVLAAIDGDLVQALTAVQKIVTINGMKREMSTSQRQVLLSLRADLADCQSKIDNRGGGFMFERGSTMLESVLSIWE